MDAQKFILVVPPLISPSSRTGDGPRRDSICHKQTESPPFAWEILVTHLPYVVTQRDSHRSFLGQHAHVLPCCKKATK